MDSILPTSPPQLTSSTPYWHITGTQSTLLQRNQSKDNVLAVVAVGISTTADGDLSANMISACSVGQTKFIQPYLDAYFLDGYIGSTGTFFRVYISSACKLTVTLAQSGDKDYAWIRVLFINGYI